MLGLGHADYAQLRRLLKLVRSRKTPGRRWSRFTLREVAAVQVALRLAGGREALRPGRHLSIKPIEDTCRVLRLRYGLAEPLLQANLRREGSRIVATVRNVTFEPVTGQLLLGVHGKICTFLRSIEGGSQRSLRRQADSAVHLKKRPEVCKAPRGVRMLIKAVR
jgi:hypothetical protein